MKNRKKHTLTILVGTLRGPGIPKEELDSLMLKIDELDNGPKIVYQKISRMGNKPYRRKFVPLALRQGTNQRHLALLF